MPTIDPDQNRTGNAVPMREQGLVQRVRRSLDDLGDGEPRVILVGYSGGADSLALLCLLADLRRGEKFELRAVHVDHGVRAESKVDRSIAETVAEHVGVPLDIRDVAAAISRHGGVGREEAMRRARYQAFADVSAGHDGAIVALAHHQRDQAETVLLHLLRGAGIRGAAGMRRSATIRVPWWEDEDTGIPPFELPVWRPLLSEPAEVVRDYAESLGLPIAADASNTDETYRRNALRHSVLPVLERVAPGSIGNVARFAELAASDSDFLDGLARAEIGRMGNPEALDSQLLLDLAMPVRRRVLHLWLSERLPASFDMTLNRLDEVLRVAASPGPARTVQLGLGWSVRVQGQRLTVRASGE